MSLFHPPEADDGRHSESAPPLCAPILDHLRSTLARVVDGHGRIGRAQIDTHNSRGRRRSADDVLLGEVADQGGQEHADDWKIYFWYVTL